MPFPDWGKVQVGRWHRGTPNAPIAQANPDRDLPSRVFFGNFPDGPLLPGTCCDLMASPVDELLAQKV